MTKFTNVLDTESFGDNHKKYYFDLKKARNNTQYLRITRFEKSDEDTFRRTQIIFFEEDLAFFIEAISMLLGRHATGNTAVSC